MLLSRFDFEYVLVDCFLDMQQVTSSSSSYSNGYGGSGKRRIGLKFLGETSSLRVGLCICWSVGLRLSLLGCRLKFLLMSYIIGPLDFQHGKRKG